MSKTHGRHTIVTVDGDDISQYCNTSELTRGGEVHQTTGYGLDDHTYSPGLGDHKFTMGGIYDSAVGGPRATLEPLILTDPVVFTRKIEGTGTGKPLDTFSGIVQSYVETAPVADMVSWSCDVKVSGAVAATTQS